MLALWAVDALTKVFPDERPARSTPLRILAARGASESAQLAFRSDKDLTGFEVRFELPRSERGEVLEEIRYRRVEFVPVRRPAWYLDPRQRLRSHPAFVPDPLIGPESFNEIYQPPAGGLDRAGLRVSAESTLPLWITLRIPLDARPGRYAGAVTVRSGRHKGRVPVEVEVSPARCPAPRSLKVTHWFSAQNIAEAGGVASWSDAHWKLLEIWGRNLAEHRANVVLTPLSELLLLSSNGGAALQVDFSRFDRWVETFQRAGAIGYIEGGHLAERVGKWKSGFGLTAFKLRRGDGSEEDLKGTPVESPRARQFLAALLPPLVEHLKRKNWLSRYFQHQADEPIADNAASYRVLAERVKEFAPQVPRLDASMADESLVGTMTVWCPQSQEAEKHLEFFKRRQALGEEVWHYTCLAPSGLYPNRFLNQPLLGTRVLHWFNFSAGLTGYLHWGFNHWKGFGTPGAPWCDTESTRLYGATNLPAGDTHLVYPGPQGQPLDSIRHEMVLEGIQDYELLKVLAETRPKEARRLARTVVPSLTRYEKVPRKFRAVRARLLAAVGRAQGA